MSKPIDTRDVERFCRAQADAERDYGRKNHAADWDARANAIRQERERAEYQVHMREWYQHQLCLILNQCRDEKARQYARYALTTVPAKEDTTYDR